MAITMYIFVFLSDLLSATNIFVLISFDITVGSLILIGAAVVVVIVEYCKSVGVTVGLILGFKLSGIAG